MSGEPPAAGYPGFSPARPRRTPIADYFDDTFRLYRLNFVLLLVISAIVQIPTVLATIPLSDWERQWTSYPLTDPTAVPTLDDFGPLVGWFVVFLVLTAVLGTFGSAALTYVTGRGHSGDHPPPREVLSALGRLAPALVGYMAVLYGGGLLLIIGFVAVLAGFFVLGAALGDPGLGVLLAIIAFFGGVIGWFVLVTRLVLTIPVLVLERRSVIPALRRSWDLVRGSMWRTAGIFFLAGMVVVVITTVVSPLYLPGVTEGILSGSAASYFVVVVVSGLVNALVSPILAIILTVVYFDYARGPAAHAP